jgi:hypothetical protein
MRVSVCGPLFFGRGEAIENSMTTAPDSSVFLPSATDPNAFRKFNQLTTYRRKPVSRGVFGRKKPELDPGLCRDDKQNEPCN